MVSGDCIPGEKAQPLISLLLTPALHSRMPRAVPQSILMVGQTPTLKEQHDANNCCGHIRPHLNVSSPSPPYLPGPSWGCFWRQIPINLLEVDLAVADLPVRMECDNARSKHGCLKRNCTSNQGCSDAGGLGCTAVVSLPAPVYACRLGWTTYARCSPRRCPLASRPLLSLPCVLGKNPSKTGIGLMVKGNPS
jgi:hypothetical protein